MAGIGFVLRKLSRQDNLVGTLQAYVISALISAGPWLFTILALGTMTAFFSKLASKEALGEFRQVIIYNFAFSLVIAAPIFMIVTRYLADSIYSKDVSGTPGLLLGSMTLLFGIELPLASAFYFLYADIELGLAVTAIGNFLLISGIWLISIFITALKNYKAVTQAFALGMLATIAASTVLAEPFGSAGIINSFNLGLAIIMALLIARIFAEYSYPFKDPFVFFDYFKKYWEIALSGLVYNLAIWADKWIMWFAPEAERLSSGFFLYPDYDSAMFLAYLTIIPSMAMFILSIETNFFEHYLKFYRDIQQMATFKQIRENQKKILECIFGSARSLLVLQGSVCVIAILMSSRIFDILNINYLQIGIFRFGVLGALFQIFTLFLIIILSYFDNRLSTLAVQSIFLVTNVGFTLIFLKMGFKYYGYGYFLASLVTFVFTAFVTLSYIDKLIFHSFITRNVSVE